MSYLNYITTFCWKYWGFKDWNKIILWVCLNKALSCLLWLWYKIRIKLSSKWLLCPAHCPLTTPSTFTLPWALAGKQLSVWAVSRQPPFPQITAGSNLQPAARGLVPAKQGHKTEDRHRQTLGCYFLTKANSTQVSDAHPQNVCSLPAQNVLFFLFPYFKNELILFIQ